MYKNYRTYRHFINASIYKVSLAITSGNKDLADELISSEMSKIFSPPNAPGQESPLSSCPSPGVSSLPDGTAKQLLRNLKQIAISQKKIMKNINVQLDGNKATNGQIRAIVRITKYKLNWSKDATLGYILETCPEKRKRLTPFEIQNAKLGRVFFLLTKKEADKIIKRLDKLQKTNSSHERSSSDESSVKLNNQN